MLNAVNEKSIDGLRKALHAIRPLFYVLGLPDLEEDVKNLYARSLESETVELLTRDFMLLWQKLLNAQDLINEQHKILESTPAVHQ
jgi:hypothetical protein